MPAPALVGPAHRHRDRGRGRQPHRRGLTARRRRVDAGATSTITGQAVDGSRIAYAGGNQIASGDAPFTQYQPIYGHRLVWARTVARRQTVTCRPASAGVVRATSLPGSSAMHGQIGTFIPSATLSGRLASGSVLPLSEGLVLSESGQPNPTNPNDSSLPGEP